MKRQDIDALWNRYVVAAMHAVGCGSYTVVTVTKPRKRRDNVCAEVRWHNSIAHHLTVTLYGQTEAKHDPQVMWEWAVHEAAEVRLDEMRRECEVPDGIWMLKEVAKLKEAVCDWFGFLLRESRP